MLKNISSKYNMKKIESKWYKFWEKNDYFHQPINKNKKPFCIVMPPPNITGSLHLGHAMDNTIQDIIIRFKRMQGYNTLWIPGVDHAGIATQKKVEEDIEKKEGLLKKDLKREEFIKKAWKWKKIYHKKIRNQLKLLGSSCDWKSERFTLDKGCSDAVKEAFLNLYKKGFIYKGKYIVNWCPKCLTTISDIEVNYSKEKGILWNIKYYIVNSKKFIVISTTRPETIFGDAAIAVSPNDDRYKSFLGKFVLVPLINRKIPIIEDENVDKNFGTGAIKVTPSHDNIDFEISIKNKLQRISVIDKYGKIIFKDKQYNNLDRFECRNLIIKNLKKEGNLISYNEYIHSIGRCYRCNTIIEPLISNQWFIKMKKFGEKALKEINKKSIFIPNRFTKTYINWIKNIKDWCISRQLLWGHRIPIWYCNDCKEIIPSKEKIYKCIKCNSNKIYQDEDVLDTWFSSALWPFSSLGWPKKTKKLKYFYPINLLVTGRDIIFFWVARMLFMGLEFMNKIPFKNIFIHGLILDKEGRKMSKSIGNGIDPIKIINIYGADSLRFMLITNNTPGNDICFQENKLEGIRNFCNKIWNASRFLILNLKNYKEKKINLKLLTLSDKWIIAKYNETIEMITNDLKNYELGSAADKIYEFIWDFFCDWYIEISKFYFYKKESEERVILVQNILNTILKGSMQLLHPFMPFITEEIWQQLPHTGDTIMFSKWPKKNNKFLFAKEKIEMEMIIEGIRAVRNLKVELNIPLNKKIEIFIYINKKNEKIAQNSIFYFKNLVNAEKVNIIKQISKKPKKSAMKITSIFQIYLPLIQFIDFNIEKTRLKKELKSLVKEIEKIQTKLKNLNFIKKAPKKIVKKEKEKLLIIKNKFNLINKKIGELE